MNSIKSKIFSLLLLAGFAAASASATTIDFEQADAMGIPHGVNYVDRPIHTQGFAFSTNMDVIDIDDSSWSGTGPAHSGIFATLNDYGGDATLTAIGAGVFSLQDFWIHGWFGATNNVTVRGFLGGTQVGLVTSEGGAGWVDVVANFAMVDTVIIGTGGLFLLDDISVNGDTNVPEPASLALLGLGFAGLAAARRRKQA